jgi:hypothetical protein
MSIFDPGDDFYDMELRESRYENYGAFGRYRNRYYDGFGSLPLTPWNPFQDEHRYLLPNPFAPNPQDDTATGDTYRTKCEICVVTQWRKTRRLIRNSIGVLIWIAQVFPTYSCTRRPECRDREKDRYRPPGVPPEPKIPKGWGLQVMWAWTLVCTTTVEWWPGDGARCRGDIKYIKRQYQYKGGRGKGFDSSDAIAGGRVELEDVNGNYIGDFLSGITNIDGIFAVGDLRPTLGYNGSFSMPGYTIVHLDTDLLAVVESGVSPTVRQRYPAYHYPNQEPTEDNGYGDEAFNETHKYMAKNGLSFWRNIKLAQTILRKRIFYRAAPDLQPGDDYREEPFDLYNDWFRPNSIPYLFGIGNWFGFSTYWSVMDVKLLPPNAPSRQPFKDDGKPNPNGREDEDDPMNCCEDHADLLRAIYKRLGCNQYPVTVPETLVPKDEEEKNKTRTIENLTSFMGWKVEQLDALMGQFPIEIKIPATPELDIPEKFLKFPNLAESIAEIVGILITEKVDSGMTLDLVNRTIVEVIAAKNAAIVAQDLAYANSEYLGYKIKQITREVESTVNVEKLGNYKEFAQSSKYKILSWKNEDKNTVQDFLSKLMFAASIIKEVFYMPASKDKEGKKLKQILKNIQGDIKQSENDWEQFVNNPLDLGNKDPNKPKIFEKLGGL